MDKKAIVLIGCNSGNEGKTEIAKEIIDRDSDAIIVFFNTDELEKHKELKDARKHIKYYADTCTIRYDMTEDDIRGAYIDEECEIETIFDIKGKMKDYTETRIYAKDIVGKEEDLKRKLTDLDWKYTGLTKEDVNGELKRLRKLREYIRVTDNNKVKRKFYSFVFLGNSGLAESYEAGLANAKQVLENLDIKDVKIGYVTDSKSTDEAKEIYRNIQEDLKNIKNGCKFDRLEINMYITNMSKTGNKFKGETIADIMGHGFHHVISG